MDLQVLNVGDGASAVVRAETQESLFLIDCGSGTGGSAVPSAMMVANAVGASSRVIESVLITHFDADHWAGIAQLPKMMTYRPSKITLYYPHLLPRALRAVQAAHLLFQSALGDGPVGLISHIIDQWESAGVQVTPCPIGRGDTFRAADADWTVHWPPRDLTHFAPKTVANMQELASQIERVAAQHDDFRRALEEVQRDWYRGPDVQADDDSDNESGTRDAREVLDALIEGIGIDTVAGMNKRLKSFANMLSVVHASETLINFGDCEKAGLNALLRAHRAGPLSLEPQYEVILAPHHGTQVPGSRLIKEFPKATRALINQNGYGHYFTGKESARVQKFRSTTTQSGAACQSTFVRGHVTISGLR